MVERRVSALIAAVAVFLVSAVLWDAFFRSTHAPGGSEPVAPASSTAATLVGDTTATRAGAAAQAPPPPPLPGPPPRPRPPRFFPPGPPRWGPPRAEGGCRAPGPPPPPLPRPALAAPAGPTYM